MFYLLYLFCSMEWIQNGKIMMYRSLNWKPKIEFNFHYVSTINKILPINTISIFNVHTYDIKMIINQLIYAVVYSFRLSFLPLFTTESISSYFVRIICKWRMSA